MHSIVCVSAGLFLSAMVFALAPGQGGALAAGETERVRWLLEQSGLDAHLSSMADSIVLEADLARQQCPDSATMPPRLSAALDTRIRQAFAVQSLMPAIAQRIEARLTSVEIESISQWMKSPAGTRVRTAEASVSELDEAGFEAASAALLAGDGWTPARRALISALIRATGAAGFLTMVNTELSAAVLLAGACGDEAASAEGNAQGHAHAAASVNEALASADASIAAERRDETFYAVFMALQLTVPTGVVFAALSDTELQAYLDFARSAEGRRYHDAVTELTRIGLRLRVANLRDYLSVN